MSRYVEAWLHLTIFFEDGQGNAALVTKKSVTFQFLSSSDESSSRP